MLLLSQPPRATWALVPLKAPARAKSRLAVRLHDSERQHLFFALAERVIRALLATSDIDHVAVVTASTVVADFARSLQVEALVQLTDAGMSAALCTALAELPPREPTRVLMIAGDLPLISPAALRRLFVAAGRAPGIALVPDRHFRGTNALLCTPPQAIAPCFGPDSYALHLDAAAAAGVPARVLQIDELALDLDEPADLEYLQAHHVTIIPVARAASRATP